MITITNLHKTYGNKKNKFEALKGINLTIRKGESIAIIGKSGSGKSTLMHLMAGLDKPTEGDILYDNQKLSLLKGKKMNVFRNKQVGFVFQQFFLQPNQSVLENVVLPLKIKGIRGKERNKRAMEVLKEVEIDDKVKNKAVDLSGGQKQRVCIARALINNPEVIFADEPTGNLDSQTGRTITDLLFKLNQDKGITLVIVTHDQELADLCERKIYIEDGLIK